MSADPFSDILKLVNAETVVSGGFTAGGAWAIRFPAPDKIKFSVVVKGTCWVIMDGEEEPVRAETGDVFLLSAQRSFVLASDQRLAPALRLMHGDPGRSWQLEELARAVAMSRTTFASHFKAAAGVAPLTYLTQWRMHLAERALREEGIAVAALARSLGYTSESAFSNAFKRATGKAPKHYRSAARRVASRGGSQDQDGASLDLLEPAELAQ
ncbi:AraC-type DNA-binding protein [Burkholderia sp. D7]|nr:AraC-type DNA-binding protein [Burkholderia sp. D7]